MELSTNLVKQFVDATNDSSDSAEKPINTTVYGTAIVNDSGIFVRIDGSDMLTPVSMATDAVNDDRVLVTIENHKAYISSNLSSPSSGRNATNILEYQNGVLVGGELRVAKMYADKLIGEEATFDEVEAKVAEFQELVAASGEFGELKADVADVKKLTAEKADIDFANVLVLEAAESIIQNLLVKGGIITDDITSVTGEFTKYLTGVNISGDLINAGTISTERLIIRSTDSDEGILFAINDYGEIDQTKLSDEELKRLTLDGKLITAGTITADKISVTDLSAFGATIGGFVINKNQIKTRNQTIVLNDDGSFHLGNVDGGISYNAETNLMGLDANTVIIGSDEVARSLGDMLSYTEIKYAVSSSQTECTASESDWSELMPERTSGTYIWQRTINHYADGHDEHTDICIQGLQGEKGEDGVDGVDGEDGVDGANGEDGQMLYATCTTPASTAAKVADVSDGVFELVIGATVAVYFTYANTASYPTLNVNNTGAKAIRANDATIGTEYYWSKKAVVMFVYDGSYWVVADAEAYKTATNYMTFDNETGLCIGDHTATYLGNNVLIDNDSVDIRDGDTVLASYSANKIELGKNSENSVIEMCGGIGIISAEEVEEQYLEYTDYSKTLTIESNVITHRAQLILLDSEVADNSYDTYSRFESETYIDDNANTAARTHICNRNDITLLHADIMADVHDSLGATIEINAGNVEYENSIVLHSPGSDDSDDPESLWRGIEFLTDHEVRFRHRNSGYAIGVGVGSGGVNRGLYDYAVNNWMIRCDTEDLTLRPPAYSSFRPYFRPGDVISVSVYTAGFLTGSSASIYFMIPLGKPCIEVSSVTPASTSGGFILRQDGKYTHGSAAGTYKAASSMSCTLTGDGTMIRMTATFSATTNAVNNAPIGIQWNGRLTFN